MQVDCIFCKIAAHQIPVQPVYEDELIIAFSDINPVAPVHILVIPKKHLDSLLEVQSEDQLLLGHMFAVIPQIASQQGLAADGFRLVVNTKEHGGQTVHHLHCHLLGGRFMTWPPG